VKAREFRPREALDFDMRLARKIVVVVCLGLPAPGVALQQQGGSVSGATGQAPVPGVPQNDPAAKQKPADTEKEASPGLPQSGAKAEPKKKADSDSGSHAKAHTGKGRAPATMPDGKPRKVVVREGGLDEPTAQIVTGMSAEEANRQRQDTEQLLKSAEETLRRTDPHTFGARQQETVSQIHNYMAGAQSALKEGDIARAHTLAVKAGLLAEDVAKH